MTDLQSPWHNHLLGSLPTDEYERLSYHLEPVEIRLGDVLCEPGKDLRYAYFPKTCIVSLLYVMQNGAPGEIAMVGNDGMIGVSLFMGGGSMPYRAVVRSTGLAYRLRAHQFMKEFNYSEECGGGTLHELLLRYTQGLMTQIAQTSACNRHHLVDQQLCRWLLLNLDRLPSNELMTTQELIANMLGVRREGVTEAAGKLQQAGLIEYRRGRITILDRRGLETRACECYEVVKAELDRLLFSPRRTPLTSYNPLQKRVNGLEANH